MDKKSTALFFTVVSLIQRLSLIIFLSNDMPFAYAQNKVGEIYLKNSPRLIGDQVTLRLKLQGANNQPLSAVESREVVLRVDGSIQKDFDWKPIEAATPSPSWILILLDMSIQSKKAVQTIQKFISINQRSKNNTWISLVPFGLKAKGCQGFLDYKDSSFLDHFLLSKDVKLQNYLDYLKRQKTCSPAEIYKTIEESLKLFGNQRDQRFYSGNNIDKPRISILLLKTQRKNNPTQELNLKNLLAFLKDNNYDSIPIHIFTYESKYPSDNLLRQIAYNTGGIWEFEANPSLIAEKINLLADSLPGEYQLSYIQQKAEKDSKHYVTITINDISTIPYYYTISAFGQTLPFGHRLFIIEYTVFLLFIGGIVPYILWGKMLKNQNN